LPSEAHGWKHGCGCASGGKFSTLFVNPLITGFLDVVNCGICHRKHRPQQWLAWRFTGYKNLEEHVSGRPAGSEKCFWFLQYGVWPVLSRSTTEVSKTLTFAAG